MFSRVTIAAVALAIWLQPIGAKGQAESPVAARQKLLLAKMQEDVSAGYRYIALKEYFENASMIPTGTKLAVAGHIQSQTLIADVTRRYTANIVITRTSAAGRQIFLQCFKARATVGGFPCPTIILGVVAKCDRTSYGIEDGSVPCLIVDDAWSLFDIAVWSLGEIWRLTPIEELIPELPKPTP